MAALRDAGATWPEVAARFGVAKSTARKAVADHVAAGAPVRAVGTLVGRPVDLDVERLFIEVVSAHESAMAELARLGREADNDAARVGALKGCAVVGEGMLKLLAIVGLLPNPDEVLVARARRLRAQASARAQAERILAEAA
jgi:predicted transcriptional regulator